MPRHRVELEPGETIRAQANASFRGATSTTWRATFALGSARMRYKAFEAWRSVVESSGFPTAGPEMVLQLTDRRVLVCATNFWTKPATLGGSLSLSNVADIATIRHGMVTSLAFALTNGAVIEVEAIRGRALRQFADAVLESRGT